MLIIILSGVTSILLYINWHLIQEPYYKALPFYFNMRRNNNNNNNNTNNMWISPQKQLIWRKQDRFHVPNILKSGAFRLQIQNWIQSAFFFL